MKLHSELEKLYIAVHSVSFNSHAPLRSLPQALVELIALLLRQGLVISRQFTCS
jgi:hypothetical protein